MLLALLGLTLAGVLTPLPALHLLAAPLLVLLWPGVAVARWLGQRLHWRDLRSWATVLPLGTAFSSLVVFTLSIVSVFTPAGAALAIALFTGAVLLTAPGDDSDAPRITLSRAGALLIALTVILVFVALAPLRTPLRDNIIPMWGPIRAGDSSKHYGIPVEIEVSGIPPQNLFYFTRPPQTQVYYIFFYIPVALLDLLTDQWLGLSFWLVACATLTTLNLLVLVYTLARRLFRYTAAAVGALLYTSVLGGLDIIPVLYDLLSRAATGVAPNLYVHLDGWPGCNAEVSTFFTAYTWVPHHTASLVVLLAAWLIYEGHPRSRRAPLIIALLVVSAVGHSVYVPLGAVAGIGLVAVFNSAQALRSGAWRRALSDAWPWALAAALATLVAIPLIAYEFSGQSGVSSEPLIVPWVRTGSVPVWGLVSGTVFRQLFPQGGILAQMLDLPLNYLIEIGPALPLALLGLAALRGRRLERGWLIGLLSMAAGLVISTFLKSTLSCNDLGMRSIFPAQAVLALLSGGGWLALTRPSPLAPAAETAAEPRSNMPIRAGVLWGVLAVAGALLAYQWPHAWRADVLSGAPSFRPVTGLYAPEGGGAYRWTRERVGLSFDGLAANAPYQLVVRAAAGGRPAGAPPARVRVWANGAQRGQFDVVVAPQAYAADLGPDLFGGQTGVQIELQVDTFRPADFGLGDRRALGVLLESVELLPAGPAAPFALPSWDVLIACACAGFFGAGMSRRWMIACVLAPVIALLIARPLAAPALPYAAALLGMIWFVRYAGVPAWRAVGCRLATGQTRPFKLLIAPLVLVGLLTTLGQLFVFDVARFLPALDAQTARADAYSFAYSDALRAIRTQTRPETVMQVDPDLGQSETAITVAAHRRSLFVHDNAWLYATPLDVYAKRRERIQQAFAAPTMEESCSIFRSLGIDVILIEPQTRAYNWLVDKDEPDSCFKTVYADALVTVLEITRK